jgi:hypothetical protein
MCEGSLSKTAQSTANSHSLYAASSTIYFTLAFRDLESIVVEKMKAHYDLPLDPSKL